MVGVIAPWNYPWSIPFGEVAIALMAGNGVVLKPASLTPLIGERIREIFEKAGLPEGLVRTVHGGGADRRRARRVHRAERSSSPAPSRSAARSASSAPSGSRARCSSSAARTRRSSAPTPTSPTRSPAAVWGGFANAGQTCSGIERIYVVEEVADRFVEGVVRETERLTVGDPLEWDDRDRPDGLRGAVRRSSPSSSTTPSTSGAEQLAGGPTEVPGLKRQLHRARRADRRHARHADHERGDLRPGACRSSMVDSEEEAHRARQRLEVRPRRVGLDEGPRQGRADGAPDRVRHGVDQRPLLHARRLPVLVGRRQGVRPRPLALEVRLLRVRRRQAASPGSRAGRATSGGSRTTARSARPCAPRRRLLYGRNGQRLQALREGFRPLWRSPGAPCRRASSRVHASCLRSTADSTVTIGLPMGYRYR